MDFCTRCGCYVKDEEVYCPECGNMVHQPAPVDIPDFQIEGSGGNVRFMTLRDIFSRRFYICFIVSFLALFLIVTTLGFSIFLLLIPLFVPAVKPDLSLGITLGFLGGMIAGWLFNMMQLSLPW